MSERFSGRTALIILAALLLSGCFRQASPDISPSVNTLPPATALPLPDTAGDATPFITPFAPGTGPDITSMPTLNMTETVAFVEPGAATDVPLDQATALPQPGASATIPFAAGATYTPAPAGGAAVISNPVLQVATSTPDESPESSECIYRVEAGDTAFYIAQLHDVTLDELIRFNRLDDANRLFEGQELKIPNCGEDAVPETPLPEGPTPVIQPPAATPTDLIPRTAPDGSTIHVVQPGENLFRIAMRYGTTIDAIVAANNLGSASAILQVGQQLSIPND